MCYSLFQQVQGLIFAYLLRFFFLFYFILISSQHLTSLLFVFLTFCTLNISADIFRVNVNAPQIPLNFRMHAYTYVVLAYILYPIQCVYT